MTNRWTKLGLSFYIAAPGLHPKLRSHTANPLAVQMDGDAHRVYYCARDADNRSSIGAVDIDIVREKILKVHDRPLFQHGSTGTFYEHGVSIGNCYWADGACYMLFMGWQRAASGHWKGEIGRLIVNSDFTLELESETPFLAISEADPISLSYPWVLQLAKGDYAMWYGSTRTWDAGNGEMLHVLNYAISADGHHWNRQGLAVPYDLGRAQAFSRPSVIEGHSGGYEMWFSYRGNGREGYRIGHAISPTGKDWMLDWGASGLDASPNGWDSEMVEYPFVFDHQGSRYMYYCGNDFGKTGFGLAVQRSESNSIGL